VVDRAIILKMGRVVSDGPSEDLRDKQDLWEWF
jgi:ABC-type branched-subunit amino acid transport system ATPase component